MNVFVANKSSWIMKGNVAVFIILILLEKDVNGKVYLEYILFIIAL
jgi:hypothetical protein